mgnify:CR=1 FL=1
MEVEEKGKVKEKMVIEKKNNVNFFFLFFLSHIDFRKNTPRKKSNGLRFNISIIKSFAN